MTTEEMLAKTVQAASEGDFERVEFRQSPSESLPIEEASAAQFGTLGINFRASKSS